jgi:sugar O-acyltransferase (sialic acid O-acetyltransferase NeuD family)
MAAPFMADIVIFGAGQLAELARVYIERESLGRVVGFTVDADYCRSDSMDGLPIIAWEELEAHFPPDQVQLLGPISFRRMNEFRRDRHLDGLARGYRFATVIHPGARVYSDKIGDNCLILDGNTVQPAATIGRGVLLGSGNHVGHHSRIGDYCFISTHVTISGACDIGERCYFAPKATVEMGVSIGAGSYLGSATLIRDNLPEATVVPPVTSKLARFSADRIKRLV